MQIKVNLQYQLSATHMYTNSQFDKSNSHSMQPFAIINTCYSTFIILGSLYRRMMPEFFIKYMYIMCYNGLLHYLMSYMYMYVLLHVIGLIQQLSFETHIHNNILQPPTFSCCSLIKLNRYSKLLGVTPLKSCWKFSTSSDGPTV